MLTEEQRDLIQDAIRLVAEARELVDCALEGTDKQGHYEGYGKYGLADLLGDGNPYNTSLLDLLEES